MFNAPLEPELGQIRGSTAPPKARSRGRRLANAQHGTRRRDNNWEGRNSGCHKNDFLATSYYRLKFVQRLEGGLHGAFSGGTILV